MDFTKIRCSICFKHFCCSAHRSDHQVKCHTETFAGRHNNHAVKVFPRKTYSSQLWTQSHQEIKNTMKRSQTNKISMTSVRMPPAKRLHSAINKRILSTTVVTVASQKRRILVPVHRLNMYKALKEDNKEVVLKDSNDVREESPCVDGCVKTSTPIISPLLDDKTSQIVWNISSESTISNYQTPTGPSHDGEAGNQLHAKPTNGQVMVTPLRGIILKSSKYDSGSDSGPSPNTNTNSLRGRRVTFSSSSQISTASTPLESIQEVEIYEEIENIYDHIEDISANVKCTENTKPSDKFPNIRTFLEDSTPPVKYNGLLSCMTNMFCSAIHTIPSLAPWRKTGTDFMLNKSKRSRSPEGRGTLLLGIETPLHKRPCYPKDLRKNPIKSRRPISNK